MAAERTFPGVFRDKRQLSTILEGLHAQRSESKFCDVILRVCGEQIFAHSNVLAAASPYFSMLFGQNQDLPRAFSQKTPQIIEIHIDGSDGDGGYGEAVHKVVDFMYTSTIEITLLVLTQVMEIARIMQMDTILRFCDDFQLGITDTAFKIEEWTDVARQREEKSTQTAIPVTENILIMAKKCAPDPADNNEEKDHEKVKTCTEQGSLQVKESTGAVNISDDKSLIIKGKVAKHTSPPRILGTRRKRGRPVKSPSHINIETNIKKMRKLSPEKVQNSTKSMTDGTVNEGSVGTDDKKETREKIDREKCTGSVGSQTLAPQRISARIQAAVKSGRVLSCLARKLDDLEDVEEDEDDNSDRIYACEDCSYTTQKYTEFKCHRRGHEVPLPLPKGMSVRSPAKKDKPRVEYSCEKCEFKSTKSKIFNDHRRAHMHEDNICSICGLKSENREEFNAHLAKHGGPLPHFCSVCDAKFRTRTQLNLHSPKHWNEKPFKCELCKAGFKWKHALNSHMNTHKETKDHLCDVCGFSTAHKSQLKAHHLIHTGETFKCDIQGCGFQATKRQNLKYHMLTHTHEKPHQCEICGQSFSLMKNMRRHLLLHKNDRPYKCDFCTFCTTRYDKLKEHHFKQHNIGSRPGKKMRITDYKKREDEMEEEEEIITQTLVRNETVIANGTEGAATYEIHVAEDDTEGGGTTQVFVDGATGETIPVITRVETAGDEFSGEVRLAEIQFDPTMNTIQYVAHVE